MTINLTNPNKTPFGEMTREEQEAMAIARYVDRKPVQTCHPHSGIWRGASRPDFEPVQAYRISPHPMMMKVDWSCLSDEIRYITRDRNGEIWGFDQEPSCEASRWIGNGDNAFNLDGLSKKVIDPGTVPWNESLVSRPEGEG